jgi:hypothetical protein
MIVIQLFPETTGQQREGPHTVTVRSVYRMAGAALPGSVAQIP